MRLLHVLVTSRLLFRPVLLLPDMSAVLSELIFKQPMLSGFPLRLALRCATVSISRDDTTVFLFFLCVSRCGLAVRRSTGKHKHLGSIRFGSPFSSKMVVYGHRLVPLPTQ